jgi:hypothetical protein
LTEIDEKVWTLTALDRCDACDAQALVHVKGVVGELMFCGHHYNKADKVKLEAFAYEIIDERDKVNG